MRTLLLSVLFLVPLYAGDPPAAPSEEDAKAKVEGLKKALKGADEKEKKAAIAACADCPHALVVAALAPVMVTENDDLRIEATKALGKMKGNADAAKALHGALKPNEKHDNVLKAVFTGIALVNHVSSVAVCEKWIDDRLDLRDSDEVPGVIHAFDVLGFLKHKASVEVILDLCNKKKVSGENAGTGGGYKLKCGKHAEASLVRLTGQEAFGDLELWKDWWKKHAGEFNEDMTKK